MISWGILVEFVLPQMHEFSVLGEMQYGMLGTQCCGEIE